MTEPRDRSEYNKQWYAANKSAERTRAANLKKYGLTIQQYDEILLAQGGVCAICGRPPATRRLSVDHDHKSGVVRGLLCWSCNHSVLGAARDQAWLLRHAADYLDNPPAVATIGTVIAPPKKKKRRKKKGD